MIDSVLKDVREAENKAEAMQKEAYQHGKEIVLNAEKEADAQKKSTVHECKEDRARAVENARKVAAERTREILADGAKAAAALADEKNSAIEDCADKIVAALCEKYNVSKTEQLA